MLMLYMLLLIQVATPVANGSILEHINHHHDHSEKSSENKIENEHYHQFFQTENFIEFSYKFKFLTILADKKFQNIAMSYIPHFNIIDFNAIKKIIYLPPDAKRNLPILI